MELVAIALLTVGLSIGATQVAMIGVLKMMPKKDK